MIYQFDSFTLNTRDYLFKNGERIESLEPRVFDLLAYLIQCRDRIVPKEELIEKLWDGRIISDAALNTCIRSVRRALGDDGGRQNFIRTFPKRGFQFVGHLVDNSKPPTNRLPNKISASPPTNLMLYLRWFAAFLLVALALIALFVLNRDMAPEKIGTHLEKPSIAVLDFDSTYSDETQRYFTEGLVEELVGSLARYRDLFVIARNSSALFRKDKLGIKEIGRQLGAEYIVDGSVRYDGDRVKISARLVDSRSGQQIWSEDFERNQLEIYDLQGDLAYLIAGQIVPELVRSDAEKNSKKPPDVLGAWALYQKARTMQAVYTREMQMNAIHWAELALERDPNLASAYGVIARAKGTQYFYGWAQNSESIIDEAIDSARRAINLDSNDPGAYAALGYIYRYTGDETSSIANLERATFLNPSDASIKLEYAHTLDWFRYLKLALPQINQAIKLSPRDPRLENMYFYKAHIQFQLLEFEESLETTKKMSGVLTTDIWRSFYFLLRAANLAQLERIDEARQNIQSALEINPQFSLTTMRKRFEGSKNHPDNRKFWLESLEKAGLPK